MQTENPYEPSQELSFQTVEIPMGTWPQIIQAVREIFLRWEKWRIGYNLTLVIVSLAIGLFKKQVGQTSFWGMCVMGAVVCNVCYFLGPIVESYLTWLRERNHKKIAEVFFVAGLLLSTTAAVLAIIILSHLFTLQPPGNLNLGP